MPPRANDRSRAFAVGILVIAPCAIQTLFLARLPISGISPDLALCTVVSWALLEGGIEALACAFVSGLLLDLLAGNPLGMSAIALIAAASFAVLWGMVLPRTNPLTHMIAVIVATITYYLVLTVLVDSLQGQLVLTDVFKAIAVPSAALNAVVALPLAEILRRVQVRFSRQSPRIA